MPRFQQLPVVQVMSEYWAFRGGLDQVTPSITIPAGRLRAASNVEIGTNGGVTITQGYERFDGRTKPSDATYYVMTITLTGSAAVGNTITGASSGATGVLIAVPSGSFVFTKLTGTFTNGETLNISGSPVATVTAEAVQGGASTRALDAAYRNLAADQYRSDIAAVTGSGSILGVWKYNGSVYAFRNNAGGTAAVMWKESASGWTSVNLGRELAFTAGQTQLIVGATITGAISGATAVIGRIVVTSGSLGASTGVGFIYFASQTGTFQAENIQVGGVNRGTIAANSTAITLSPSGRYEFVNHNFGGSAATLKMYGVDGVNKGFEFDGATFARITTGMTTDAPDHVCAFKNHLVYAFDASVQHSGTGDPVTWSVVLGAAEIAMGEIVTNFLPVPGSSTGGALGIYTRNTTKVLYGNDSSDWNLVTFNPDAGAFAYTAQYIGQGVVLDDRGLTTLGTSQAFGNFAQADISALVKSYVAANRDNAIASCVVREKNQYRLFFSGGAALYITFIGNKTAGATPVTLTNPVTCICSLEGSDGVEEIYFGSTNGMVYQMDKGTSHDGEALAWSFDVHYNHFGSPRQLKQYRKAVIEMAGSGYNVFNIGYSLGYGTTELPSMGTTQATVSLSGTNWDSFTWDQFFWDGSNLTPSEVNLDGTAENISLSFSGSSDEYDPITFNGCIVDFTPRRAQR